MTQRGRNEQDQNTVAKLKAQVRHLYMQCRVMLRALRHPAVPWYTKAVCGVSIAYIVSPIQLIPNFIPVIGQLDDVLLIGLSIKLLTRSVPSSVLMECQLDSGVDRGIKQSQAEPEPRREREELSVTNEQDSVSIVQP